MFLAGEWISAWLWMSITFVIAFAGVIGLGWWVLRGDARNRAASSALESPPDPDHSHAGGH